MEILCLDGTFNGRPHCFSQLKDVENAAHFIALIQDSFELLAANVAKREPTYFNSSLTKVIGPPTSRTRVLNGLWRDALLGERVCTATGMPGTWMQIRPAAVTAAPNSGMIPTEHFVWNVTTGHIKRHAGGFNLP